MRAAYLIVLALVGCSTLSEPPLPKQPDAPTSPAVVAALETAQDKVDGKVAAAVTVAREANTAGKPAAVDSELGVALSFLDPPTADDLNLAKARAERSSPQDYDAARNFAKKLVASLDAAQAKLQSDEKEAVRVSALKDSKIAALTADLARAKAEGQRNVIAAVAGLCFLAALTMGLLGQYVRAGVAFGVGTLLAALPVLFGSNWFLPVLGGLLLAGVAGELIVLLKPKAPAPAAEALPPDEQAK